MMRGRAGRGLQGSSRRVTALRRWLLAGIAVLTVVLACFFGYQIRKAHRMLEALPGRLGIDVRSQADGFTYTQSVKGRVLFTVHAAKAIQRQNGKTTLHNVSIVVQGKPGSNRSDSIRGDEFEYDQANGVIQAVGEVHVDLAAPDAVDAGKKPNAKRIVVTTRGLILLQKLGIAATDQPLQFVYGDLHGSADGADYDADSGMLRLRKDVRMDGETSGKPVHLVAADAELDRVTQQVTLHAAQVQTGSARAVGNQLVLLFSHDGAVQSVDGEGAVALDTAQGEHLRSARVHAMLSNSGQVQQLTASGNVHLQDARYTAEAGAARLHFDTAGEPVEAELTQAVQVSTPGSDGQPVSELKAPHAVLHLTPSGAHTELRDLVADGGATLRSVEQVAARGSNGVRQPDGAAVVRTTAVSARVLHATTAVANGTRFIADVDGQGSTTLEQSDSLGNRSISTADTLHALLGPPAAAGQAVTHGAALRRVEQAGNVQLERHQVPQQASQAGARAGTRPMPPADDSSAHAQRAVWDVATDSLELTGNPVVSGPGMQIGADTVLLSQKGSGAEARGNVKGTLQQGSEGAEPLHVLAAYGRIVREGTAAEFRGGPQPVRLWTSTAQLEAMHVDVDKTNDVLVATGGAGPSSTDVRLFLSGHAQGPQQKLQQHGPIQVTGQRMTVLGAKNQVPTRIETTGNVHLVTTETDLHANEVTATLKNAVASAAPAVQQQPAAFASGLLRGSSGLASLLASGNVQLRQPGRTAKGELLRYTATDDVYRLSGTRETPSSLHDSLRGDVTGLSLVFHGTEQHVEVSEGDGRQVHTELPARTAHPQPSR